MSYGKYKEVAYTEFSGGLNTKWADNLLADNQTPDCQNIIFDGKGALMPRTGVSAFGTANSAIGAIHSTYVFNQRDGTQIPLRSYDDRIEYYHTDVGDWCLLNDGFTADQRFGYAYYASKDIDEAIYFCNGVNKMYRWNGRISRLLQDASATSTQMYLSTNGYSLSALGWQTSGFAIINGDTITYTSLSANVLSGVTRASGAFKLSVGDDVAQFPLSTGFSSAPIGNILRLHQSRLHVAGVSNNLTADYYSKINNPLDFTYAVILSAGDGGIMDFPEGGGAIKTLGIKEDSLIVFKENCIRQLTFSTDDFPIDKTIVDGVQIGAGNDNAQMVENAIFYVSPLGYVKNLERTQADMPLTVGDISDVIAPTVRSLNVTSCAGIYYGKKYYVASQKGVGDFNNELMLYDASYNAWTRYAGINANSFFIYNNDLYYGSSNERKTYKFTADYDDSGLGYESYYKTKKLDFGLPGEMKRCRFVYVEGYLTENQDLDFEISYDDNVAKAVTVTVHGDTDCDITDTIEVFGEGTIGKGTLGGPALGDTTYLLNKFRVRLENTNFDFFNMQITARATINGSVFKLTHMIPYVEELPGKKFTTTKQLPK